MPNNNNNNNLHPLDDLNKFNSKPISQSSLPNNNNLDRPYQAGNMPNSNNNNNNNNNSNLDRPYQAGNMPNFNNNIPYGAGNFQYQTPNQYPIQQQQMPIQQQQMLNQQQMPIQQQIPVQPQVTYVNPPPVIMTQPTYVTVPNVQYGVCPYCGGSGISFQTGFRCRCVGGMSSGDMFALGLGLGMMGPCYGYGPRHRHFFFP